MKKKITLIVIPIVIAFLVLIGVIAYINKKNAEVNFTIKERNWISANTKNRIDFEIINSFPIYSMDGTGVVFDFLKDFEIDTNLEFNKIAYNKEQSPNTDSLKIRILSSDTLLSEKDLLIAEDGYVLISKTNNRFDDISEIGQANIGVFTSDSGEASYYLKRATSVSYKQYDTITTMIEALTAGDINYIMIPQTMYLQEILSDQEYNINYYFTEMSKKIVLTLTDNNPQLNGIVKKYYEKWKKENYVDSYNSWYLKYYATVRKLNDKTKTDMISKSYTYGYVENLPYEKMINGKVEGIAAEYIGRLQRLTDVDITYQKYKTVDDLKKAIEAGKVDFYFNYFNYIPSTYNETKSPFVEKYVVLRNKKSNTNVTTFEELKNKNVSVIKDTLLINYLQSNSKANIQPVDNMSKLTKNSLIAIDFEIYNYYRNSKFKNYEVLYIDTMTNNYTFGVLKDDLDIYNLFNYIMTTNSYYNYRTTGINALDISFIDTINFSELYLAVLGIALLPVLIVIAIVLFLKNRRKKLVVTKEDRRKYTDMLTSLKNRNYLNVNMKTWEESKVYPQTIVMVDLNNIKYVNDNYGHEAGDNLIIAAASTLVNTQLENSEIIRTDGNEFLIYLIGYSEKQIDTYCKKLNKEFKELPYGFGAALGYSMIIDDIKTIDDAINEATIEMKTNKEEIK